MYKFPKSNNNRNFVDTKGIIAEMQKIIQRYCSICIWMTSLLISFEDDIIVIEIILNL